MSLAKTDVYFDPYDSEIRADPYPVYRRLREEAPLYYNERHDFYAVSRFEDAERVFLDRDTFISSRGGVLDVMKADIEIPPGMFLFEDPPRHVVHRGLVARVFTPKRMNAIEPQVREFCARTLDPHIGAERFDFVQDLGDTMPMSVIGMLLGIPESEQEAVREGLHELEEQQTHDENADALEAFAHSLELFGDYIEWRAQNPSDDLMTQLLNVEFEDELGATRKLRRDEVLMYVNLLALAGTDTTRRLIGWTGKVLADHPDQRRELVENPALSANAIEELLRFEPPPYQIGRFVIDDAEFHGEKVPAGKPLLVLPGAVNRDDRRFENPDVFDIHRNVGQTFTFGFGSHFCLGAALARLEGRVALEEVLARFPTWVVDTDNAQRTQDNALRGWDSLPVRLGE